MTQQSQQLVNNMAPQPTCNNNNGAALLAAITPLLHNLASQSNPESEFLYVCMFVCLFVCFGCLFVCLLVSMHVSICLWGRRGSFQDVDFTFHREECLKLLVNFSKWKKCCSKPKLHNILKTQEYMQLHYTRELKPQFPENQHWDIFFRTIFEIDEHKTRYLCSRN